MDIKKWLKLQELEVANKGKDPDTYIEDGVEYNIKMSQQFGDEWFFKLVNGEWDTIIPGFCKNSAVYAMANDCLVNLILNGMDADDLKQLVGNSIEVANEIIKDLEKDE